MLTRGEGAILGIVQLAAGCPEACRVWPAEAVRSPWVLAAQGPGSPRRGSCHRASC